MSVVRHVGAGALALALAQSESAGQSSERRIVAVPVSGIRVDGRLDEAAWHGASWTEGFVQRDPAEGTPATQPTRVAIAFDDVALYVAARLLSTDPTGIRAQITRRDVESSSEQFIVSLDTYRDRRTAFSFGVTAAGVRVDYYHSTDDRGQRDYSYDPVWEAATSIDGEGWTAEMRIPFGQLRFNAEADQI